MKPSCRVQCVVVECEGLLVGLDDCCTTTASRPPSLSLPCKWCLTMLGSNWMDRGDVFFDYCSLHHQNSLTCLFMLRSENIVPVTITIMSLPCAGTTKPRRHNCIVQPYTYQSLLPPRVSLRRNKNFLFPDHSLHRSDWTHGLSSRMQQMNTDCWHFPDNPHHRSLC